MDPNGEPVISRGSSKVPWVMDGRFVQEVVPGEFESAWMDNQTTQIYRYTGWKDDEGLRGPR